MKQPALGIAASFLVIAVSLGFIALFTFPIFANWVAFLTICFIPMQIVISVTWGCKHPAFAAARLSLPRAFCSRCWLWASEQSSRWPIS